MCDHSCNINAALLEALEKISDGWLYPRVIARNAVNQAKETEHNKKERYIGSGNERCSCKHT